VRTLEIVLGLITAAVVVATLAGWLRAPAPPLLVLAGLGVGLLPGVPPVEVPPDVISLMVLPPLLYAAAGDVAIAEFRAVIAPVLALAVGLVAVTAAAVALTVTVVEPRVPVAVALVLGSVLASTDPVAVSALARRLRLPPRLLAIVQGESLLNDATSLVLFQVAVGVVVAGNGVDLPSSTWDFVRLGGGGALVGLVTAAAAEQLRRRTRDSVLGSVQALLVPYVVFLLATLLDTSGVTAVVVCGLRMSAVAERVTPGPSRLQIDHLYAVLVFVLESVVFALIGLELPGLVPQLNESAAGFLPAVLAVAVVVVLTRVLSIYPTGYLQRIRQTGFAVQGASPWPALAVMSWAGTRGVVPLAAALAIPLTTDDGAAFPQRNLLLVLAISCIAITLVVQGLTLEPLVRRLGVGQDSAMLERERALARHAVATAALDRFDELVAAGTGPPAVLDRLRRDLEQRSHRTRTGLERAERHAAGGKDGAEPTGRAYRRLRLDLLTAERAELSRLREDGRIEESVRREIQRGLDLEEARLTDEPDSS
jgi:CPA1 family monovalent cation:H+ antiporter